MLFWVDRRRLSVLRHMLRGLAPAEANLATCAPREPPATGRCRYGFPAPSALQGCFLNLPTEAFDEAFSSGGLLTTEPCATVTTMPCPTPRPAVRRRRWRSTRPRTSSTSRRQRCAYLPARSLSLGLADGGHAALRGRAGRTLTWSSAGSVNKPLHGKALSTPSYRHSGPCRSVTGGRSAPGGRTQLLGHNDPSVTTGCSSPRASAPMSASPVQPSSPLKAGAAMRSAGMTLHASSLLRDRTSPSGGTKCRPD